MHRIKFICLASSLMTTPAIAASEDINVLASIKPVHSLVAAVMDGVGEPNLIIEGAGSPHTYALKPSQAQTLEEANLVFWIGHQMEAFLEKPLEVIASNARSVELADSHDLVKLELREGGAFDAHDHGDDEEHEEANDEHDHDDHDHEKAKMDHDDHDDHDHEEHAEAHEDHDHEKHTEAHDDHDHGAFNPHLWLDPVNAKAFVHEIEEALVAADPANADTYQANAEALTAKLDELVVEVSTELEPVKGRGFVIFHDAYQNFEERFGLTAIGSITVSPEVMPGAERISELQSKIKELNATCVFSEPQFEPKLVGTVAQGTQAKTGVLDPLGASIDSGPELYFTLIRNMSTAFKTCLSEPS